MLNEELFHVLQEIHRYSGGFPLVAETSGGILAGSCNFPGDHGGSFYAGLWTFGTFLMWAADLCRSR